MALWKPLKGNRTSLDTVEKHDGYVYFCTDDGTLFFDYVDAEGNLQRKQINAKDAETLMGKSLVELQSDWSVSDEISPAYVRNRTHWAEAPVTTTTVHLPESTIEFEEGYYEVEMPLAFTENTEYTVTWDGIEYTSVSKKMEEDGVTGIVLGNTVWMNGEDNGQPFMIIYIVDYSVIDVISMDGATASHTVGITQTVTTQEIHKLDDKYINAEWLPQKTMVPTVGVVETTMTVKDTGEDMLPSESYDMNALESAEYCEVLWNGTTYKCVPQQAMGIDFIGNTSIWGPAMPDSGEPFLFCYGAFVGGVAPIVPAETEATFSITCYNSTVVSTIPEEYLPEKLQFGNEYEAEIHKEAITWDGDITGRVTMEALSSSLKDCYHVSSSEPTLEETLNGGIITIIDVDGSSNTITFDANNIIDANGFYYVINNGAICVIGRAIANLLGLTAGIYFANYNGTYISSLTINNYTFVETETKIKTIDPKYLPEGIGGSSGLPEVSAEDEGKTVKVVDGEWSVEQMSYNDLSNKPTLGALASKNTISKTDLASDVQTSLGKADTALQSYTEADPTVPAWAKAATKPTYTASEVGAVPTTRTINGKALSSNISLSASDIGAMPNVSVTITDNGAFLRVVNGAWAAVVLPNVEDGEF
jgi:hypothetical protein